MKEYPKIQSVFKRDEKTHKFIEGEFSLPEFEYLKDNIWICTEKVDGTNIRIMWDYNKMSLRFGGKTDNAQIPPFLNIKLGQIFTVNLFEEAQLFPNDELCLYGEGYGARIQKGGGNYISDGVDFVLFDVWIDGWWLRRKDVEDIASQLKIKTVPILMECTLPEAIGYVRTPFRSEWGDFHAEGLVCKPQIDLFARNGQRIITKMKTKDFV